MRQFWNSSNILNPQFNLAVILKNKKIEAQRNRSVYIDEIGGYCPVTEEK